MKPSRARSCTGKVAHASKEQALGHAIGLRRRLGALPRDSHAYRCRFCGSWHVGHRQRRRRK